MVRRSGVLEIWENAVRTATMVASVNVTDTATETCIGSRTDTTVPMSVGEGLALLRFTAAAPSPAQLRRIYEDEKALFIENAKAFLGGTSDRVQSLSHDDARNLLAVGTTDGLSVFSGLRRTAYHDASTLTALTSDDVNHVAAAGGMLLLGSAAEAGFIMPAVVGKEAVLAPGAAPPVADPPITVVAVDATPVDVAPRLHVGERELVMVESRFVGRVHGPVDGERLSYVRRATVYRDAGGVVTLQGGVQTIGTDTEVTATADLTLVLDTINNTVTERLSGVAGQRIVGRIHRTVTRIQEAVDAT